MRKPLVLVAAACMVASTLTFVGYQSMALAQDDGNAPNAGYSGQPGAASANLPQGITPAPANQMDTSGIQQTLATCVNGVVSGNWNAVDNCLAKPDRQRINLAKANHKDLNQVLTQFKQDWRAKYNQDFNLPAHQQVVFGPTWQGFEVAQGEVSNPAMLSNWPVESGKSGETPEQGQPRSSVGSERGMHASAAGPGQPSVNITAPHTGAAEARAAHELNRGAAVAVVTLPAQPNAPQTTVSLVRQGRAASPWKIDIPDDISSQQLADNFATHLSQFDQMKNQWPGDVNQAYRLVTNHVYAAMYNTGAAGEMQSGGMIEGPNTNAPGDQHLPSHSEK